MNRAPMARRRTPGARRQDQLRRAAYSVVNARSGGQCEMAAEWFELSAVRCPFPAVQHHHRRPRRAGGSTDPVTETAANVLHVCGGHHGWVESRRALAYQCGWLVRACHDPAVVPVRLHVGRVLLAADGTFTSTTKETTP